MGRWVSTFTCQTLIKSNMTHLIKFKTCITYTIAPPRKSDIAENDLE